MGAGAGVGLSHPWDTTLRSMLKEHTCGPQATESVVYPSSGWEPVVASSSAGSPNRAIPFLSLASQYLKIHALLVARDKEVYGQCSPIPNITGIGESCFQPSCLFCITPTPGTLASAPLRAESTEE